MKKIYIYIYVYSQPEEFYKNLRCVMCNMISHFFTITKVMLCAPLTACKNLNKTARKVN